jgi:hypothetical protein
MIQGIKQWTKQDDKHLQPNIAITYKLPVYGKLVFLKPAADGTKSITQDELCVIIAVGHIDIISRTKVLP